MYRTSLKFLRVLLRTYRLKFVVLLLVLLSDVRETIFAQDQIKGHVRNKRRTLVVELIEAATPTASGPATPTACAPSSHFAKMPSVFAAENTENFWREI